MQCGKCGAVLEADAVFCPECGGLQESAFSAPKMTPAETENTGAELIAEGKGTELPEEAPAKKHAKWLPVAACIATTVVAAVALLVFFALRPKPYTTALDTYIAVSYGMDFSGIHELAPEEYWAYLEKNGTDLELEMKRIGMHFLSESYNRQIYCGNNLKVSYEIKEIKAVEENLGLFKEELEQDWGISPESVGEVFVVKYFLQFSGATMTMNADEQRGYIIYIDGEWYLAGSRSGSVIFIPSAYEGNLDIDSLPMP